MEAESIIGLDKFSPPKAESAPWLVFIPNHAHKKKSTKSKVASSQNFYSISRRKTYIKDVDEMRGYNCWSTPRGWIFMQEPNSRRCCLWNPSTLGRIDIPSYKWNFSSSAKCVISSSPLEKSKSCRLMCLDNGERTFFIYNFESCEWSRHDIKGRPLSGLFAANGEFYCMTDRCKLAVIDLTPNLNVRVLEDEILQFPIGVEFMCYYFFVESNEEMFSVQIYSRVSSVSDNCSPTHITVFQRDDMIGIWKLVDQIGGRVFFLGPPNFAASCSADKPVNMKGNCIYFLYADECCMYIYDMDEGTIQVEAPCQEFLQRRSSTLALWIMPSK